MSTKNSLSLRSHILVIILTGIVLILSSIILQTEFPCSFSNQNITELITHLVSELGIALFVTGVIGITLELFHFVKYFEDRLSKFIREKKYLEELDEKELRKLQTDVLKAFFKNDQIGESEGFLEYLQNNIQSFVDMPFRTNVEQTFHVDYEPDLKTLKFKVVFSYYCNNNNKKAQEHIQYYAELKKGEDTVEDFEVILRHKDLEIGNENAGEMILGFDKLKEHKYYDAEKLLLNVKLGEIRKKSNSLDDLDKLYVEIRTKYTVPKEKFNILYMRYPTRGAKVTIEDTTGLKLNIKEYFSDKIKKRIDPFNRPGFYSITIDDWLMPNQGMAFQFLEPSTTSNSSLINDN